MSLATLALRAGEGLLLLGCVCACFMQAVALRSPDVRDSMVACALRRLKIVTWALFGGFGGYLLFTGGALPIHMSALIALLALSFCDAAWPVISLFERDTTDPRMTQPAPMYETDSASTFDDRPHHHH
jgi:hypothetical protein